MITKKVYCILFGQLIIVIILVGCVEIEYELAPVDKSTSPLENNNKPLEEDKKQVEDKSSKIYKMGTLKLSVPELMDFNPKIFPHPEKIKLVFIEVEPINSENFELTEKKVKLLFDRIRTIFEEISGGVTILDEDYVILPKKIVNLEISDALDQNINNKLG